MQDLGNTQYFKVEVEPETGVKVVLSTVYEALSEKGYNPVIRSSVISCREILLISQAIRMPEA